MSTPPSRDSENSPMAITEAEQKQESPAEYPSTEKRILIMLAGYLAVFLISLASHPLPLPNTSH
jgi:hypothetical protein